MMDYCADGCHLLAPCLVLKATSADGLATSSTSNGQPQTLDSRRKDNGNRCPPCNNDATSLRFYVYVWTSGFLNRNGLDTTLTLESS